MRVSLALSVCELAVIPCQFQRDREVVEDTDNDLFLPLLSSEVSPWFSVDVIIIVVPPPQLTEVLRNAALQSPALLVALLAEVCSTHAR